MNEDRIAPGAGFPTHPHADMEIVTYVLEGALEHKDSLGNGSQIRAGELQLMTAGRGIEHSEFNPSQENKTLLYQIWLRPNETGGEPRYAEKLLGDAASPNALTLLFSGDGRDGSTAIRQDAEISFGRVEAGLEIFVPASDRMPHAWVQLVSGEVNVLGQTLQTGDGLAIEGAPEAFALEGISPESRILVFRLS